MTGTAVVTFVYAFWLKTGVPIAFITGRSGDFIRHQVVTPLCDAGLGEALEQHGARMFGVFEKGGAWAPITGDGMGEVTVDETVAFTPEAVDAVRSLVRDRFADTMFFDETKRAMISVEQRTDVDAETYAEAQSRFQDAAFEALTGLGVGLRYGSRVSPDASGEVPTHFTFGAHGRLLSNTVHPAAYDPAGA